ncbi:MAG: hypothetical protein Q8K65_10340 [Alphaproteobacteria bacterium]|nr:hypothetical protein [Alphaproteobacteria bacterium]
MKKTTKSLRFKGGVFGVMAVFLLATVVFSPEVKAEHPVSQNPVVCDQSVGIGEVFYNFEKLYIYYAFFPDMGQQKRPEFPEPLRYENFNARLMDTIKANFGACLKTAQGGDKPIIVIPPAEISGVGWDNHKQRRDLVHHAIHDPKDLTIFINVSSYQVYPPRSPEVEDYGQAMFYIYRPEVSHKLARLPLLNNSGMLTFFPRLGEDELEAQLAGFFKRIRPARTANPPESDVRFLRKAPGAPRP